MNITNMELEELQDIRTILEERLANYFNGVGDSEKNFGDSGYQELLTEIGNVSEQISNIEDNFDNNPEVIDQSIFNEFPDDDGINIDMHFDTNLTFEDLR